MFTFLIWTCLSGSRIIFFPLVFMYKDRDLILTTSDFASYSTSFLISFTIPFGTSLLCCRIGFLFSCLGLCLFIISFFLLGGVCVCVIPEGQ